MFLCICSTYLKTLRKDFNKNMAGVIKASRQQLSETMLLVFVITGLSDHSKRGSQIMGCILNLVIGVLRTFSYIFYNDTIRAQPFRTGVRCGLELDQA
jgi:hypothetical protein